MNATDYKIFKMFNEDKEMVPEPKKYIGSGEDAMLLPEDMPVDMEGDSCALE